jgi:hypothetical protein
LRKRLKHEALERDIDMNIAGKVYSEEILKSHQANASQNHCGNQMDPLPGAAQACKNIPAVTTCEHFFSNLVGVLISARLRKGSKRVAGELLFRP